MNYKEILSYIQTVSKEKKKIVVLSMATVLQPLVELYQKEKLTQYVNEILETLWAGKGVILESQYRETIDIYFEQKDYDEFSYESFSDDNFKVYLAFMATEILACYFNGDIEIFCNAAISMFLEINEVLDEFEYRKNSDNSTISILSKVTQRRMMNASKVLLTNILMMTDNEQSKYKAILKEYSTSLSQVIFKTCKGDF